MKAAQINGYGGPEVMLINDAVVAPVAAAGEVLVAVHAASVNPFDIKVREGAVRAMAELEFPAILGGDAAGIVAAIGQDVTGFIVGQEVYGVAGALSSHGSFAEFVIIKAGQLANKPTTVDFTTAAALPLVSASAYQALVDHMELQAGQKILIHGAAGGIGSIAVQIAKNIGAYVATTAGTETLDYVTGLGADEVIDYQKQDFTELLKDYNAVFDTVGGDTYTRSFSVVKPGGIVVTMAATANEVLASERHVRTISQFTQAKTERLTKIAAMVDAGKLSINVDKVFSLDQVSDALEYLKTGHPKGKVVIKIADD